MSLCYRCCGIDMLKYSLECPPELIYGCFVPKNDGFVLLLIERF
jgi:hypothetical protein